LSRFPFIHDLFKSWERRNGRKKKDAGSQLAKDAQVTISVWLLPEILSEKELEDTRDGKLLKLELVLIM
jgi:hypothetical protein